MSSQTIFIIGIIAGILTSISMFPQVIKIFREKKAKDVSLAMPIVLLAGHALWIMYGIYREDIPIIIPNAVAITIDAVLIFVTVRYRKN